jgi:hypothetical protein
MSERIFNSLLASSGVSRASRVFLIVVRGRAKAWMAEAPVMTNE